MRQITLCLSLLLLSGCATVVGGTSQVVSISTAPEGAACKVERGGAIIGMVPSTPGLVQLSKGMHDLSVSCSKPGYDTATARAGSSFNGYTFGNLIIGGAIGIVVDVATGANFDYPPLVDVAMNPTPGSMPPVAALTYPTGASVIRVSAVNRGIYTTRMMALPDSSTVKQSFLLGACSAGDETACILKR